MGLGLGLGLGLGPGLGLGLGLGLGEKNPGGATARVTTCGDVFVNAGVWCARCGGGGPSLAAGEKRSRGMES